MNFELSDDIAMLRDNVAEFGRKEIEPHAADWDAKGELPSSIVSRLGELGLLGLQVSESYGGSELSMVAAVTLLEALAQADGAVALLVANHNFGALGHLERAGHTELLGELVSGRSLATWAAAEPERDLDLTHLRTTAEHTGGTWRLHGEKRLVVSHPLVRHTVVVASTDPDLGSAGLAAFLLDRDAANLRATRVPTLGMRAVEFVDLQLHGVEVSSDRQLGHVGHAAAHVVIHDLRLAMAAVAVGIGRAAINAARGYAVTRKQFGQPIANFQAIQWKVADAATELDAAWLLVLAAAHERAEGRPVWSRVAQAKLYASAKASQACSAALQIHGGYGYTEDFPVERCLRNAKWCQLAFGNEAGQRSVISAEIERRFAR